MNRGVAVSGMGIISAIGNNTEENYRSLLSKKSGISFTPGVFSFTILDELIPYLLLLN